MKVVGKRMAALLLLLLVLALAWYAAGEPLRQAYLRDRQAIDSSRDQIGRYQAIAGRLAQFQSDLRQLRLNPELTRAVLRADSETLAAADLQQRVKSVVESLGGALVSTQVLEPVAEAPFTRVRINVRMLLSVSVLQQVLHAIEGQMPYLLVRQLLVTKRNWRGRNRPGAKSGNDALDVRMTISGYWYAAAAAAGAG